jgi:hypothetical protein
MYKDNNGHIALWPTMMQGQQFLMLYWRLLSRWGREHVAFSVSDNDSQYFLYYCLQPVTLQIAHDTRQTIIDAQLTLNIRMV